MAYRLLTLIMVLVWLQPCYGREVMDLHGGTHRVSGGDTTLFDGREVRNGKLIISEGNYLLRVKANGDACLIIGDNTELVINGTLTLAPNNYAQYDMIRIVGKNVKIHGSGTLVGDKFTHTGKEGEWGMGIEFRGASNATLSGLTIKNCWGDCVYVGKKSGNVTIENCQLNNGRRQGISITEADSVIVRSCTISNISGTNPQYGIDIEPNRNCSVNYVLVDSVEIVNSEGGIRALVPSAGIGNAFIGTVVIRRCRLSAKSRYPLHFSVCKAASAEECVIEATNERPSINANYVENLSISNNTLNVNTKLSASIKNQLKKLVGRKNSVIRVANGSDKGVKNNTINEK